MIDDSVLYAEPITIAQLAYDDVSPARDVPGRYYGVSVDQDSTEVYRATYDYDSFGRLDSVDSGPGLPAGGVAYGYMVDGSQNPLADIVTTVDFKSTGGTTTLLRATREFEDDRNLIDRIGNVWDPDGTPATISSYVYANDVRGRRTSVINEGDDMAFAADAYTLWDYNSRSELTESHRYLGDDPTKYATDTKVEAEFLDFEYDPIGNRTSHTIGSATPEESTYECNAVNQYTCVEVDRNGTDVEQGLAYDDDGNLIQQYAAGDMNCDGDVDFDDVDAFVTALGGQAAYEAAYPGCRWLNGDIDGSGVVDFDDQDAFVALIGVGGGMSVQYTWDGENRLTSVGPVVASANDVKVEFTYDYLGRRVSKTVSTYNGSAWQISQKLKFIWHGWLMLVELEEDAQQDDDVMRKYTWGLDLAGLSGATGSLEGAGGIGGLLATYDTAGTTVTTDDRTFLYTYDANGNVGQLVETTAGANYGDLAVKYEYGPYGSRVNTPAQDEYEQPFRFSTRQWDDETGLGYWGYRYYSPVLGRWVSRDPIGERGGPLLYGYAFNEPIGLVDALGDQVPCGTCPPGPVLLPPTVIGGVSLAPFAGAACAAGATFGPFVCALQEREPVLGKLDPYLDARYKPIPYSPGMNKRRCNALHAVYKALQRSAPGCGGLTRKPGRDCGFCKELFRRYMLLRKQARLRRRWLIQCHGRDAQATAGMDKPRLPPQFRWTPRADLGHGEGFPQMPEKATT